MNKDTQKALIFGIDNNTEGDIIITVLKESKDQTNVFDPEHEAFHTRLFVDAYGFIDYRSILNLENPVIVVYIFDQDKGTDALWDITDKVLFSLNNKDIFDKPLEELKSCIFSIDTNKDNEYVMKNEFTDSKIEQINAHDCGEECEHLEEETEDFED